MTTTADTCRDLMQQLCNNINIVPALIECRNAGTEYAEIAANSQQLFGRELSEKSIAGMFFAGLRYGVLELTANGYCTGPTYTELKQR